VLAGAVGIGASMSLQNIAPHVLGGMVVMFERTIKVGDHIEIGNVIGRVTDISLRSTAFVTNDNIAVIIPNAELVTAKVINWSYKDKNVRLRVPLAISKQCNLETIKRLLVEAALTHPGVLSRPAPEVRLTGFSSDAVNLSPLIWTHDYAGDPERLQSDLNYKIVTVLEQAHLPMPLSEGSIVATAAMMVK
jgi:small-conductance mechanosensitive channel